MLVLNCQKETLLKPLQAVVGVVERKHTLPILSNILVENSAGKTALIATDLELQITTWMAGESETDTAFTVSARKLLDITRSLPDETSLALDLNNEQLRIQAGKSRFNLQTLPAKDFPKLQSGEGDGIELEVSASKLRKLLARAQYAMAVQDIRYYLNGMLFQLQGNKLVVAATDGHRLAVDAIELEAEASQPVEVILPRKTVMELIKLLGEGDEKARIRIGANQVVVSHPDFELRSKVVDGKFPDYQRVVPVGYEKYFDINRQRLHQSLARAAILTNDKYRGVRLAMTAGTLRVACSNNEQEEAQEELEIEYAYDALDIGFNVQYIQDVLNNLDTEAVRCLFGDANSSMLITVPGDDNFRYVVMPMRI
ncbi:DNA polymerase III subunit beta [Parasulfuritortus cantonensis]|uniref:Beta sliding clamp n=1 Tax=Parasulfuritortus cantonensis TaxID=2528202 RepID=A0A4R1B758_9PROT|nr:DNA polymerase III subunit beta [Parasulfuritortus cantonensis]TCJ12717.1 DNA polymerase III subunit beta [Parasulfuritortus cantonensis]